MNSTSTVIADRMDAALSPRVWCFGRPPATGCHAFLLMQGRASLGCADRSERAIDGPALLWLPASARGSLRIEAGGDGFAASANPAFVQRIASDPLLRAHREAFLGEVNVMPAELLDRRLPTLRASFQALVAETHEMEAGAAAAIALHLGILLLHLWRGAGQRGVHGRSGHTTVQRFTQLIEVHYCENLRVTDYAERLGVSAAHLNDACLRIAGRTPLVLVHERLLEEARTRLRQNELSVEQVGYSLGFHDPGYFNRFFKRLTGESPGAFQRSSGIPRKPAPGSFADWP